MQPSMLHSLRLAHKASYAMSLNSHYSLVASLTVLVAPWLASSDLHLCSLNWRSRFHCASSGLFIDSIGTLNWRLQKLQTPRAGTVPTHLPILRLRFCCGTLD